MSHHLYTQLSRLTNALTTHKNDNEIFSQRNKYAVGSMALDINGNIIAVSFNSYKKTHPMMKELASKTDRKEAIYLHAEVGSIIKAKGQAKTLIVARLSAKGDVALARPCPICQMAIKAASIEEVFYTNNEGELVLFNQDRDEEEII